VVCVSQNDMKVGFYRALGPVPLPQQGQIHGGGWQGIHHVVGWPCVVEIPPQVLQILPCLLLETVTTKSWVGGCQSGLIHPFGPTWLRLGPTCPSLSVDTRGHTCFNILLYFSFGPLKSSKLHYGFLKSNKHYRRTRLVDRVLTWSFLAYVRHVGIWNWCFMTANRVIENVKVSSGYSMNVSRHEVLWLRCIAYADDCHCNSEYPPVNVREAIMNFFFLFNAIGQKELCEEALESLQKKALWNFMLSRDVFSTCIFWHQRPFHNSSY
jgi:hypothetical protein